MRDGRYTDMVFYVHNNRYDVNVQIYVEGSIDDFRSCKTAHDLMLQSYSSLAYDTKADRWVCLKDRERGVDEVNRLIIQHNIAYFAINEYTVYCNTFNDFSWDDIHRQSERIFEFNMLVSRMEVDMFNPYQPLLHPNNAQVRFKDL